MQNSNKPRIEYNPAHKPHFLAKIAFGLIAVLIVTAIVALVKEKRNDTGDEMITVSADGKTAQEVNTGQSLHSRYFDVMIDKVSISDKIQDNNQLLVLPVEDSIRYLVIEISLKNLDKESKLMPDGELRIENGSEEIKYRKSEIIIKEGWGELMDNIKPDATKKTRLVYKIPAGISGKVYYYPDILYNEDKIFLMKL
jgi:hypothetical protein